MRTASLSRQRVGASRVRAPALLSLGLLAPGLLALSAISLGATAGCATYRSTTFTRDHMVGVVYAENGAPVAGAEIRLNHLRKGISDSFGRFRIHRVPAGSHTITVTAAGYETAEKSLQLQNRTTLVRVDMVSLADLTDRAILAIEQERWDRAALLAERMARVDAEDRRTELVGRILAARQEGVKSK